ncbi:MAG: pseudouridine synthase [Vulcanimicrobiota bacterium]
MIRLDRLLSNLGYCSRKEVGRLVKSGALTRADGTPFQKASDKVDPDWVRLDGEPLDPAELILLMHKPAGFTCSHRDRPPLIFELLPERFAHREPKLSCVGRLDKDTTGLILLTDNGQLLHRLISPNWKVEKVYQVEAALEVTEEQVQRLAEGGWCLPDDDKPLAPARCRRSGERSLELVLVEGRYHQVKRMMEAVDNPLLSLHRSHFAEWDLGALEPGEWRHFTIKERAALMESCSMV